MIKRLNCVDSWQVINSHNEAQICADGVIERFLLNGSRKKR